MRRTTSFLLMEGDKGAGGDAAEVSVTAAAGGLANASGSSLGIAEAWADAGQPAGSGAGCCVHRERTAAIETSTAARSTAALRSDSNPDCGPLRLLEAGGNAGVCVEGRFGCPG